MWPQRTGGTLFGISRLSGTNIRGARAPTGRAVLSFAGSQTMIIDITGQVDTALTHEQQSDMGCQVIGLSYCSSIVASHQPFGGCAAGQGLNAFVAEE